jgi:hypothetical protein
MILQLLAYESVLPDCAEDVSGSSGILTFSATPMFNFRLLFVFFKNPKLRISEYDHQHVIINICLYKWI